MLSPYRRERVLSYEESYREMHAEAAECAEWDAWDSTVGGVNGEIAIDQIRTVSRTRLGTILGMIARPRPS